jgi:hypothetical protein
MLDPRGKAVCGEQLNGEQLNGLEIAAMGTFKGEAQVRGQAAASR